MSKLGVLAASGFGVIPTDFDAATYFTRGADLTGNADAKTGLLSVWVRLDGGNATVLDITRSATTLGGGSSRFDVSRIGTNVFQINGRNAAGVTILNLASNTTYTSGTTWRHLLASWDLAAAAGFLYVTDTSDLAAGPTLTNDTIDYTGADWAAGASADGTLAFNGCIAELWFTNTYLDISVSANRRKFISAGGIPVFLGSNGTLPTGTQPLLYLRSPSTSFGVNAGSGGALTLAAGTPTICSSTPYA